MLNITFDQARALDALARHGTMQAAARALHKAHSAVLYALRNLETQTGLTLIDRSGYRTRLTPAGTRVWRECERLLTWERELERTCQTMLGGYEPQLTLVCDGLYPSAALLRELRNVQLASPSTRIDVFAEYLTGVERAFAEHDADLMVSVLPPRDPNLIGVALPPLDAYLVVHRAHPLAGRRKVDLDALARETLLTVRGSDPRLALPTGPLDPIATLQLHDFHAKREAILQGMGFGWLPAYLIEQDLARGCLCRVAFMGGSHHAFQPHVYRRRSRALGRAAEALIARLAASATGSRHTPGSGQTRATRGSHRKPRTSKRTQATGAKAAR
jgi:DNA-binding transcriptional LysR family regulator